MHRIARIAPIFATNSPILARRTAIPAISATTDARRGSKRCNFSTVAFAQHGNAGNGLAAHTTAIHVRRGSGLNEKPGACDCSTRYVQTSRRPAGHKSNCRPSHVVLDTTVVPCTETEHETDIHFRDCHRDHRRRHRLRLLSPVHACPATGCRCTDLPAPCCNVRSLRDCAGDVWHCANGYLRASTYLVARTARTVDSQGFCCDVVEDSNPSQVLCHSQKFGRQCWLVRPCFRLKTSASRNPCVDGARAAS